MFTVPYFQVQKNYLYFNSDIRIQCHGYQQGMCPIAIIRVTHYIVCAWPSVVYYPRGMCEGYGSRSVWSVCVSVTTPAATYLVYTMQTRCH